MSSRQGWKRGRTVLCLCALLAAVALAFAWPGPPARAKGHGGGGARRLWRVLAPVTYKNLALFPVASNTNAPTDAYITLDEGTRNGTIIITEKGSASVARATQRGTMNQQVSSRNSGGGETVGQLALVNKSGKKLLLLAGEVIVGGKQDRIVQDDLIIPPVSVPVSLNVFCVEQGRWSNREVSSAGRGRQSGGSAPVQSAPARGFSSLNAISHPKLRAAAQDKKSQGEVWAEVESNNTKLGTKNSTQTYQEVYSSKEVESRMEDYVAELQKAGAGANVVGIIVARNGEFVWIDAFASPQLFARYWPKLLKSYVVDAMGDRRDARHPTVEQAERYLRDNDGANQTEGREGVYRLLKVESRRHAVFYLEDIALPAPRLLHFNKIQR